MRADGERNRERILAVARAALEREETPPMALIGRNAGVGQGTLYRHFPSWPDLVLAVHRADVDELVALAPRLLQEHPPIEALQRWLGALAEYGRLKHGLDDALHAGVHRRLADEGTAPVVGAIDLLLAAGVATGAVRADVDGADVLLLVAFLWRMPPTEEREERASRLLDVVVAGLRTARA